MMLARIENGKPTVRWGRKARDLVTRRLGYRNRNPHMDDGREPRRSRRPARAVFTGATAIAIALALPGTGTSAARIDPNRYGLRTVNAAGGSAATVAVKFTVRPVIVLVVDRAGAPAQLWTNIPGRPTDAEAAAVVVRRATPRGQPAPLSAALRAQLPAILAAAAWGHQGLIWVRSR
jgi:hypothetical protein